MIRRNILILLLVVLLGQPRPVWSGDTHEHDAGGDTQKQGAGGDTQKQGAGIATLLDLARTLNPEVAAARLEADAATAKVDAEGSLPDPKFKVTLEDLPRNRPGYNPIGDPRTTKYTLSQELPFFGKRGLKEDIAAAEAQAMGAVARSSVNEVLTRVKVAYAEYHQAHLAMEQTSSLIEVMGTVAQVAQIRYAQGLGSQQEAAGAELERSSMVAELARLEATRYKARARLNALVNRPAETPLVEEPHPRPLPAPVALEYAALLDAARVGNPRFAEADARIAGAEKGKDLADRNWFPDIDVGVTAVQREGEVEAYEAMLEVNIPLQWGLRRSMQHSSTATAAAVRARRTVAEREIESSLREATLSLQSARKVGQVLAESSLPQAKIAFQASVKSYELGRSGLLDVLVSLQRLRRTQIDQLNAFYEQQLQLAEIERLVGAEL